MIGMSMGFQDPDWLKLMLCKISQNSVSIFSTDCAGGGVVVQHRVNNGRCTRVIVRHDITESGAVLVKKHFYLHFSLCHILLH